MTPSRRLAPLAALLLTGLAACSSGTGPSSQAAATGPARLSSSPSSAATGPGAGNTAASARASRAASPGPGGFQLGAIPPLLDPRDVWAAERVGNLSPTVRGQKSLVYVPDLQANTVQVIDPRTFRVIARYAVGRGPQHVVPSYDLQTLWVNDSLSNDLLPIDPYTGRPKGKAVPVDDPYNLYFTPDGKYAVVMAERLRRIDFRDAHTMKLVTSLKAPCAGVNHADFSADGRTMLATCEFDGTLLEVTLDPLRIRRTLSLGKGAMPQDVKLSPDGSRYYIADMAHNYVHVLNARTLAPLGTIATGRSTHGLYPSRDSKYLYVTNRLGGSVSVVSFATGKVVATWTIPGGGSPDMGGVSADGKVLWLSGRYDNVVYALSTTDGRLLAKIPVGREPHGLAVWPQPGRYSLGHTGILR